MNALESLLNPNYLIITGYEQEVHCEHCGRHLKHGVRLADGRVVGADCFVKMVAPKYYKGKKVRTTASWIRDVAKVVQFVSPDNWARYGVNEDATKYIEL